MRGLLLAVIVFSLLLTGCVKLGPKTGAGKTGDGTATPAQSDTSGLAQNPSELPAIQSGGKSGALSGINPPSAPVVGQPGGAPIGGAGSPGTQPSSSGSNIGVFQGIQGGGQIGALPPSGQSGSQAGSPGMAGLKGAPVINGFDGNPPLVSPGMLCMLTWDVEGGEQISIDNGTGDVWQVPAWKRGLFVNPTRNRTYTLTAANSYGTVTARTDVKVSTNTPDFDMSYTVPWLIAYEIYPTTVVKGEPIWIGWHTNKCDKVWLTNELGEYYAINSYGEMTIVPQSSATWTLHFENSEFPDAALKGYGLYVKVTDKP